MFCKNCGSENSNQTKFCKGCGEEFFQNQNQIPQDETRSVIAQRERNNLLIGGVVIGIFATLGIAGFVAFNKLTSKEDQIIDPDAVKHHTEQVEATKSAEKTPAGKPVESTPEVLPTVESLEMDASLIDKPEELSKMFEDERSTSWFNAGATPENSNAAIEEAVRTGSGLSSYANKIADEYDQIYIDALFIKGWEKEPSLVELVNRMKEIHRRVLTAYFFTSPPGSRPQDIEPYRREVTVTKVESSKRHSYNVESTTIATIQHDSDNADKNRVSTDFGGGVTGQDNSPVSYYIIEDGKVKLAHITFGSATK